MATSLLFVSRICLGAGGQKWTIDEICSAIEDRCDQHSVKGAMICLGECLAQLMQGEADDLRAVADAQTSEPWTLCGYVVSEAEIDKIKFQDWTVVYEGKSVYIEDRLEPLLDESLSLAERQVRAGELIKIIENFRFD